MRNARTVSRRGALKVLGAAGVTALAGPRLGAPPPVAAQGHLANLQPEEPVDTTLKRLFGGRPIKDGSAMIKLELPLIAENGAVVPLAVEVTPPAPGHVKTIYVISDKNRRPMNARFNFSPGVVQPAVGTNIRLNETGDVRAIAELSDGTLYMARREIKVTVGGCGG